MKKIFFIFIIFLFMKSSVFAGTKAKRVKVEDAGGYFDGINVEEVLQEIGAAGGVGNLSAVWECLSGDCKALIASNDDTLDVSGINWSIPMKMSMDCSGELIEGHMCWDTDDDKLYVGDNTSASEIGSGSQLTEEQVEDFVGAMLAGTETRITVTYDDAGNMIDFVVDDMNQSECSSSSCDLNIGTTLNAQGVCLADGTNCPADDDAPDNDSEVPDAITVTGYMQDADINTFSEIQDWVSDATLLKGGILTDTKFCVYDSASGTIACNAEAGSTLTQEQVDDYISQLINDPDSVHTRISVVYDDVNNAYDFIVDDMNDDIPDSGDLGIIDTETEFESELFSITTPTEVTNAISTHESTYSHLNYNTAYTHSQIATGNPHSLDYVDIGLSADQIKDWTLDQGATNIHEGNYVETDPKVGNLTADKWCKEDSGQVVCNQNTPADTSANTQCTGTTTYYDGDGNCDDISTVYEAADTDIAKRNEDEVITGAWDFGGGGLEIPNSISLPGTCTVGASYMDTDATSGQRFYLCESSNSWVAQGVAGGSSVWSDGGTYIYPANDEEIRTRGYVYNNSFIGEGAGGTLNIAHENNVAFGKNALGSLFNSSSDLNSAYGSYSLQKCDGCNENAATGYHALGDVVTGFRSAAIGFKAGDLLNASSSYNSILGSFACGNVADDIDNSICIGYASGYGNVSSNELWVDNSPTATPLIFGDFSSDELTINGVLIAAPAASRTCDAGTEGGMMYDSDDNNFYGCDGSSWNQLNN